MQLARFNIHICLWHRFFSLGKVFVPLLYKPTATYLGYELLFSA